VVVRNPTGNHGGIPVHPGTPAHGHEIRLAVHLRPDKDNRHRDEKVVSDLLFFHNYITFPLSRNTGTENHKQAEYILFFCKGNLCHYDKICLN
jgi:hypothetical protein